MRWWAGSTCSTRTGRRSLESHWKAKGLDFSAILYNPPVPSRVARRCVQAQDHGLEQALDHKILGQVHDALDNSLLSK